MLSSISCGLRALAPVEGVLLWPVDVPLVQTATIKTLLAADRRRWLVPTFADRGGHPVWLPSEQFDDVWRCRRRLLCERCAIHIRRCAFRSTIPKYWSMWIRPQRLKRRNPGCGGSQPGRRPLHFFTERNLRMGNQLPRDESPAFRFAADDLAQVMAKVARCGGGSGCKRRRAAWSMD